MRNIVNVPAPTVLAFGRWGEPQQPAKTRLAGKDHPVYGGRPGHQRDHAWHRARQIRRVAVAGAVHARGVHGLLRDKTRPPGRKPLNLSIIERLSP
jgi:hypothetical protein